MEAAIVFLPLLGAFVAGFFGRFIGDRGAQYFTCTLLIFSAVLSWVLMYDVAVMGNVAGKIDLGTWIRVGEFDFEWMFPSNRSSEIWHVKSGFVLLVSLHRASNILQYRALDP